MKIDDLSVRLIQALKSNGKTVATAESCTGGGIAHALTAVPGSSSVFAGGVVSYTNAVKEKIVHVPAEVLAQYGAVSPETAAAMAKGIRELMMTEYGVSVTGIAGPDSDGSGKPVGLVYIGISSHKDVQSHKFLFSGDRASVRAQAVQKALELLLEKI